MSRFSTILIANRGEIACRVIRTAKSLGYRTVAVYSEADTAAPHVKLADEAICIGESQVSASYLRQDKILEAAARTGAGAVHPGYGFLSENAKFASAVKNSGLIFIGPATEAIQVMGNKAEAKRCMIAAGVPCVPGYEGENQADETLISEASSIGFPIMVKAAAGGGGRGMRLVEHQSELRNAIKLARAEAESAFGSGELILEKAIVRPRHVEFQVFADEYGSTIHLGERDCSIQRRHQKVVEEAPCPIMTPELRERMGASAIAAARSINYRGAGTVEFLLDEQGEFYFLEMNTRLQVEHPVTEHITGLDLVAMQIQVAQGEKLTVSQEDVSLDGHAIEVRLYTEDPGQNFLPTSGPVELWSPAEGPGVRVDAGINSGQEISPFYDSMIAKIIAYGPSREVARQRLVTAVEDTILFGPKHNGLFLRSCLQKDSFVRGTATTAFISEEFPEGAFDDRAPNFSDCAIAAVLEIILEHDCVMDESVIVAADLQDWASASPLVFGKSYAFDDFFFDLNIEPLGEASYLVSNEEEDIKIELLSRSMSIASVTCDGSRKSVHFHKSDSGSLFLSIDGRVAEYIDLVRQDASSSDSGSGGSVTAPMHGVLLEVFVGIGDRVEPGQRLAVLEAMKMHYEILAETGGEVIEVLASVDSQVATDELLIEISAIE